MDFKVAGINIIFVYQVVVTLECRHIYIFRNKAFNQVHKCSIRTIGHFFKGYKFCEWTKKESLRKQFSRMYISLQSAIHVTIGFSIIFGGKTNFVEVQKSTKSVKFVALEKRLPMGILC